MGELALPPSRGSAELRGCALNRVHWVRPELVAEVKYLAWTGDYLLRQVVYESLREDRPRITVIFSDLVGSPCHPHATRMISFRPRQNDADVGGV